MQLSKEALGHIAAQQSLEFPDRRLFELPEKVLQFGSGVLLRGLIDYYIDKANKQGLFNGRVVVVQSAENNLPLEYERQDGLYTHCLRGIQNEQVIEQFIINASVSRALSAKLQWSDVLACAGNPDLRVVTSNTSEVGIVLEADENLEGSPPVSFPGKLLALLYERFKIFDGDVNKGLVIVPAEPIIGNGSKLQAIVLELAHLNKFDYGFIDWLEMCNHFCNTLVDRIVPGKLQRSKQVLLEKKLGYTDKLMIMSEMHQMWTIECDKPQVKEVLSFSLADEGVIITPDIDFFRELKLHLLNASLIFSAN